MLFKTVQMWPSLDVNYKTPQQVQFDWIDICDINIGNQMRTDWSCRWVKKKKENSQSSRSSRDTSFLDFTAIYKAKEDN